MDQLTVPQVLALLRIGLEPTMKRGATKGKARLNTCAIGTVKAKSMALSILPDIEAAARKASYAEGQSLSKWVCDAMKQRLARGV